MGNAPTSRPGDGTCGAKVRSHGDKTSIWWKGTGDKSNVLKLAEVEPHLPSLYVSTASPFALLHAGKRLGQFGGGKESAGDRRLAPCSGRDGTRRLPSSRGRLGCPAPAGRSGAWLHPVVPAPSGAPQPAAEQRGTDKERRPRARYKSGGKRKAPRQNYAVLPRTHPAPRDAGPGPHSPPPRIPLPPPPPPRPGPAPPPPPGAAPRTAQHSPAVSAAPGRAQP